MRRWTGPCLTLLLVCTSPLSANPLTAVDLAVRIDHHVERGWTKGGIRPAALADDAEFLRRTFLDLNGRIPTVAETREFLASKETGKRAALVERLLEGSGYSRHFGSVWRDRWLPQSRSPDFAFLGPAFERWLRGHLRDNTPYDRLVRELLTVPSAVGARNEARLAGPRAFFQANENRPENLAGVSARLFLGLNLDCAQCHDHPFARWKRTQFWEYAVFFAPPEDGRLSLEVPGVARVRTARYLNGEAAKLPGRVEGETGRIVLAGWISDPDNPYFARNAVNFLWAYFFGYGLIEPLDDLSGAVPASHPELLDELARAFTDSGFDLKYLIRALVLSETYQLTSAAPEGELAEPRRFSRMIVRSLSGEQLYDSLRLAAGISEEGGRGRPEFLATFKRPERSAEGQRSILEALQFMNGRTVSEATALESGLLRAVADAPYLDTADRIETLFLAALSRLSSAEERTLLVRHVETGGPRKDARRALADVFWALLNSTEFSVNH